jgi:hypothetical protein
MLVRCSIGNRETLISHSTWLQQHRTSLSSLVQYSVVSDKVYKPHLYGLPCATLRQLHLDGIAVQLHLARACRDELQGLTALDLQDCDIKDAPAAAAAIAALPVLQSLTLKSAEDDQNRSVFEDLQLPSQLTYLSLNIDTDKPGELAGLGQLTGLVNLAHLKLASLPFDGVPGGLPSQLVQLTCLDVSYEEECDFQEQFQHLSSLTALQRLAVVCEVLPSPGVLPGLQHLVHLTSLQLSSGLGMHFSTHSTRSLAPLTALERLFLQECLVQPAALATLTQLRSLSLECVSLSPGTTFGQLFAAVSQLSLLTELVLTQGDSLLETAPAAAAAVAAAGFTALTGNTNLCCLKLSFDSSTMLDEWTLLQPGTHTVYPHLRVANLMHQPSSQGVPLSEQQLQQLCSCCPTVESLGFALDENASQAALLPLLQLSALTHLAVYQEGAAEAAVVDVAAQLTGLKQLTVSGLNKLADAALLQLTTLTALERLTIQDKHCQSRSLHSKVSPEWHSGLHGL